MSEPNSACFEQRDCPPSNCRPGWNY